MNNKNIPNHIAFILDGNGRWAKNRSKPRTYGHLRGAFNIEKVVKKASDLGVKAVSLYCFSTENWSRPQKEVDFLMRLPIKYFDRYKERLFKENIKIIFSGRRDRLNQKLLDYINYIEDNTKNKKGIVVNICFDYGSRYEITKALKDIASQVKENIIDIKDIDEDLITNNLYTKGLPEVDLMIRTSGEMRLSNYLLWQLAYAELYFTKCNWPDFDDVEFDKAILEYQNRNRRFGSLKEDEK